MTLSEILALPQGEVTFAVVGRDAESPMPLVLVDVGEKKWLQIPLDLKPGESFSIQRSYAPPNYSQTQ